MNRARTYHCTRMRHCIEQSNGLVPSLLCPSWVDCIIATRGYDFRKGQAYMALATQTGISPALMHRVAVIGSGTLDILPHNGAVVTLLAITGLRHRDSYFDIVVV